MPRPDIMAWEAMAPWASAAMVEQDAAPGALPASARPRPLRSGTGAQQRAASALRGRAVLLLESLEWQVDLIEVPEQVLPQLGELAVPLAELAAQEFDELLGLGRGHGPCLSQVQAQGRDTVRLGWNRR